MLERIHDLSLGTSLLRMMIILPSGRLRQTHQNALDPSSGLESENGSTVVNEVELSVSPTAQLLPTLLILSEFVIFVLLDDGSVGGDDGVDGILGEFEQQFRIAVVQIVEEDSSQSASLVAVRNDEVFVGPGFELGVEFGIVPVAHLFVRSVEMFHVFFVEVGGSDVGSSSEPPHSSVGLEITVVEVHRGTERVARVHHAGQSASEEGNSFSRRHSLGPVHAPLGGRLQRFLGHRSVDHRQIDSGLFPHGSVFENARHAPSSVGASPAIFLEGGLSVDFGNGVGDGDLGFAEHFLEAGSHGVISVGSVSGADEGVGCFVLIAEDCGRMALYFA